MLRTLRHRGPDSRGEYYDRGVALGVRRLAIIDLTTGDQPIENETGDIVIVANGEIYDHASHRARLESRGHRFRTGSDVEILVHLYEEHGPSFLEHVDGMFAIALWDRTRERLLLARDRFGIKPLYYATLEPETLAFCSELTPLLSGCKIPRNLDPLAIDHFMAHSYVMHPRTAFQGVHKLPPGCYLSAGADGIDIVPLLPGTSPRRVRSLTRDSKNWAMH